MSDYAIECIENYYDRQDEEAYTDHLVYIFHEFLYDMKIKCKPPRIYNVSFDLRTVQRFWKVA